VTSNFEYLHREYPLHLPLPMLSTTTLPVMLNLQPIRINYASAAKCTRYGGILFFQGTLNLKILVVVFCGIKDRWTIAI